jgi:hypothetical protein
MLALTPRARAPLAFDLVNSSDEVGQFESLQRVDTVEKLDHNS